MYVIIKQTSNIETAKVLSDVGIIYIYNIGGRLDIFLGDGPNESASIILYNQNDRNRIHAQLVSVFWIRSI